VRIDADGAQDADWRLDGEYVVISGAYSGDAIFLVVSDFKVREEYLQRLGEARAKEAAHPVDLQALKALKK
jgi:hypothetical protein